MSASAPTFGCEAQPSSFFSRHCKQSFNPTLTHQFEVEWPWPESGDGSGDGAPRPSTNASTGQGSPAVQGGLGESHNGRVGESLENPASGSNAASPSPSVPSSSSLLWRDRRSYGRETFILDLSGDPFLGGCETRRTGLLLSPGHRVYLPLLSREVPQQLPDSAGVLFWRSPYRPPKSFASRASANATGEPPLCAELVVGEVSAIERTVRQRRESAASPPAEVKASIPSPAINTPIAVKPSFFAKLNLGALRARNSAAAATATATTGAGATDVSRAKVVTPLSVKTATAPPAASSVAPSRTPAKSVHSFFFYTVPFRVRWLTQLQGRILVSLPCEERLLALCAPHPPKSKTASTPTSLTGSMTAPSTTAITMVHSYALPRGVVPLEVAEIHDRPFICVGTYEHGVLLCFLDVTSGAVDGIARRISLRGNGGVLYPVTRLAALFPPLNSGVKQGKPSVRSSLWSKADSSASLASPGAAPAWLTRAHALESLRDGVLVCSSPYEVSTICLKLSGHADGTREDFAVMRGADTILDVSGTVQPELGPMLCTTSRRVHWLHFLNAEETEKKVLAVKARRLPAGVSERVHPVVGCDRMARHECPFTRWMSGPPVLQSFVAKYVSRNEYVKHWSFGVDIRNEVVLWDRGIHTYLFQSSFQLYRCERPSGTAAPAGSVLSHAALTAAMLPNTSSDASVPSEGEGMTKLSAVKQELADGDDGDVPLASFTTATANLPGERRSRQADAASPPPKKAKKERRVAFKKVKTEPKPDNGGGADTLANSSASPNISLTAAVPLEDACSGLTVTSTRNEMIQVVAAHDRRYVSIVTWRVGPPPPPPPSSCSAPMVKEEV